MGKSGIFYVLKTNDWNKIYWAQEVTTNGSALNHDKSLQSYCFGFITETHLYNFDPIKPHFYIVKLGFTGVYIIFFIFAKKA